MINITKYIGEQFGKPTGLGGLFSTFLMNRMNQAQYKTVTSLLNCSNQDMILDIGFGNGYLLKQLAKVYDNRFYGIEISGDMLETACTRNRSPIDKGQMSLHLGNVEKIPFISSFFQKAYTINTVYFWEDLDSSMTEIYPVLKPGGLFLNAVYSKEWLNKLKYTNYGFKKYSLDELLYCSSRNGFISEIVEIKKNVAYCILSVKPVG